MLFLIALCTPRLGPAPARQTGIDLARGQYLVFIDDDGVPDPGWLKQFLAAPEANPECAAGGAVLNGLPDNVFSAVSQMLFDYFVEHSRAGEVNYVGTGNVAYPTAAFREIGGLDRSWRLWGGEDRDLCRRWRASGRRYVLSPSAAIRHYHALNLSKFWH